MNGKELLKLRKRLGQSATNFAQMIGVSRQTLSSWEKGNIALTEERTQQIRKALGFLPKMEQSDLQVSIDYLKLTFFDTTPEVIIEHVMGINPKWFVKEDRKKHNYEHWYQCGALILMSRKDQTQGVLLDLTGEGIVQFEEYLEEQGLTLQLWLKQVLDPSFYLNNGLYSRIHSTRIDLAIDEMYQIDGSNFDLKKLQKKKEQDLVYSPLLTYKEVKSTKGWDDNGLTLMFGARGNDRIFIRMYEKRFEMAKKLKWEVDDVLNEYGIYNRYELEIGKEINPYIFKRYLDGDSLATIAIELLLSKIEVYEKVETNFGIQKQPDKEWYRLFENWKIINVTSSTKESCIEKSMRWFENQVAPTLKLLDKIFGEQWVNEWILQCRRNAELTPEKEKIVQFEQMRLQNKENGTFLYFNKKMQDFKRKLHS